MADFALCNVHIFSPQHALLLRQATTSLAAVTDQVVRWHPQLGSSQQGTLAVGSCSFAACLVPHLPRQGVLPALPPGSVLLTSYLSAPQAQHLRLAKQQYLDAAGNAFLRTGPSLVLIQGQPRPAKELLGQKLGVEPAPPADLQAVGLRLLYYLLQDSTLLQASYRLIAQLMGASLGSVHAFFAKVRQLNLLREEKGQRFWVDRRRALQCWVQGYEQVLRPTLGIKSYRWATAPGPHWNRLPMPSGAYWGGEPAARMLLGEKHTTPTHFTLYSSAIPPTWGLVPDAIGGNVEVLLPPFPLPRVGRGEALLVCTDLWLSTRPQQRGYAQEVLRRYLPHLA